MNGLFRAFYKGLLYLVCPLALIVIGLVKVAQWAAYRRGGQGGLELLERKMGLLSYPGFARASEWLSLPLLVHVFWLMLPLLALIVLFLLSRQASEDGTLTLKTQSGHPLRIRRRAVNRYIRQCLVALPFVDDAKVATREHGGSLEIGLRIWITASDNVDNLQEQILEQAVRDLKQGFGLTSVHQPLLLVESVKTRRHKGGIAPMSDSPASMGGGATAAELWSSESGLAEAPRLESHSPADTEPKA